MQHHYHPRNVNMQYGRDEHANALTGRYNGVHYRNFINRNTINITKSIDFA